MRSILRSAVAALALAGLSGCGAGTNAAALDDGGSDAADPSQLGHLDDLNAFCSAAPRLAVDGQEATILGVGPASQAPSIPSSSATVPCQHNELAISFTRGAGVQQSESFHFCLVAHDQDGNPVDEKLQPPRVVLLGEQLAGSAWMWLGGDSPGTAFPADSWSGLVRGYASLTGVDGDRMLSLCLSTTMFEQSDQVKLMRVSVDQVPLDR